MTSTPPPDDNQPADPPQGMPSFPGSGPGDPSASGYGQGPPPAPARPQSMRTALILMWVGAGLSLLALLFFVVAGSGMRDQFRDQFESQQDIAASQVDSMVTMTYVATLIGVVIGVVLWLWMIWKNSEGRNWARILSTVFGGIAVLVALLNFASAGGLNIIMNLVYLAVVIAILVLLWRPESTQFYQQSAAARKIY